MSPVFVRDHLVIQQDRNWNQHDALVRSQDAAEMAASHDAQFDGENMKIIYKILCLLLLGGCGREEADLAGLTDPDSVTVSTDAVNYMHDWGLGYTLFNQADNQPIGGGILGFLEGPGGKGCCLKLPKKWRPGMQVRVEWQKSDKKMTEETMRIKVFDIPEYEKPGDLYVAFYPEDEVEIVVSWAEPGHSEWRGRERDRPYETCLRRFSKRQCEKELPKYPPVSHERIAAEARRLCQPERISQARDKSGADAFCRQWINDCKKQGNVLPAKCEPTYLEEE